MRLSVLRIRTGVGVSDTRRVSEMSRRGLCTVSAEVVGDDVFGNPIHPRVKRRSASVRPDATIGFQPRLLRQVFGDFGVAETFLDVAVEPASYLRTRDEKASGSPFWVRSIRGVSSMSVGSAACVCFVSWILMLLSPP